MRCEDQVGTRSPLVERCPHFLEMSVTVADAVGTEVIRNFGKKKLALWRISGTRHATRCVGDDRSILGNQPGPDERSEREQDRSRIAPGIRDHVCVANDLTIELGETIGYPFTPVARSQISR